MISAIVMIITNWGVDYPTIYYEEFSGAHKHRIVYRRTTHKKRNIESKMTWVLWLRKKVYKIIERRSIHGNYCY